MLLSLVNINQCDFELSCLYACKTAGLCCTKRYRHTYSFYTPSLLHNTRRDMPASWNSIPLQKS